MLDKQTYNVAFFKGGSLFDVSPRNTAISLYDDRDIAYNADEIVSDSISYSLSDINDIARIPVPSFSDYCETVFSLDYILRMCASNIRNRNDHRLSILVLYKAVKLMIYSKIGWQENDFLRLPLWLYEDGKIEDGISIEKWIKTDPKIQKKTKIEGVKPLLNNEYSSRREFLILRAVFPDEVPRTQYKFSCKKIEDPAWYAEMELRYKKFEI